MEYIALTTKDNRTITAGLAGIEGELMNVVVKNLSGIRLGDQVICRYKENLFHAYVLKIEDYNLYLYLPIQENMAPKEHFPRYPCCLEGHLLNDGKQFDITIVDLSLNGFGFTAKHALNKNINYKLRLNAMVEKETSLQIILQNEIYLPSNLFRYGSEIKAISQKDLLLLKKYLLNQQLTGKLLK
ncbi:PilZ domain-containing protein [Metabacillus sp. RGM 3146]|uniref:PilZ domain-containing protein n=1 Tax=Metabacillus sp. RGM 3146 TaxID=3401092 RepID=UPI003B9BCB4C